MLQLDIAPALFTEVLTGWWQAGRRGCNAVETAFDMRCTCRRMVWRRRDVGRCAGSRHL